MEEFRIVLADACKIVKESSRKRVISGADEDGRVMVEFSEPVGGRRVKMLTPDEINGMLYKEETSESPANAEEAMAEETEPPTAGQEENGESALERIPKDAQTGEPQYTQTDAGTAWDAIVEQTEGDKDMARSVVDSTVRDKEAALKKLESSNPKPGATVAEKIAAAKEHKAAIAAARQELEQWKAIVEVENRRKAEEKEKVVSSVPAVGNDISNDTVEVQSQPEVGNSMSRNSSEATSSTDKASESSKTKQGKDAETGVKLSDEIDENGKPLVLAKDGTTTFGIMEPESGLREAPIQLSLGENYVGEDGKNHGYGLLHIEAGHGKQIRSAGFPSVEEFVEEVAKNYVDIREGAKIGNTQTYLLEMTDDHNNTLFVQLSKDGTYWNVNSAGIFNVKYSRRKPKVYSVPALGEDINTDTSEVDSDHSEGVAAPAGNSSKTSTSKVSESPETKQEKAEKSISAKVKEASADVNTEPTEAQKEAGNYKKGHVQFGTFDITIEQPEGSIRRGTDANGKQWESKMHNTYGYFRGTEGVDGDHIDVFLSNDMDGWNGAQVFVVDQYNPDGTFDEHKVMLGFNDASDAKNNYLANYKKGWENGRRIDVSAVSLADFEKWMASSHRKTKPFREYKSVKPADDSETFKGHKVENSGKDIEVQIKHLEEIKDYPGADKKIVQSEIDRLKAKEEATAKSKSEEVKSKSEEENGVDDAKIDAVLEALSKGDEKAEQLVQGLTSRELSKLRSKVKASPVLENEWLHRVGTRGGVSLHDWLLENQYVEPVKRVSGTFKMTDYITPKNDKLHGGRLSGVYHDDKGYAVASDGIILVADKGSYDPKLKGKVIGKDGAAMENKFPDWQKIIPVAEKTKSSRIDAEDLHRFVAGVLKADKHAYISLRFPDGTTVSFGADKLNLMLRAMKQLGTSELLYTKNGSMLVAKSDKGAALLMWRVYAEDDSMEEYGYAYPGNTVSYHRGEVVSEMSPGERVLRDAVIDRLRESGMEVITDEEAGQRVLDEANGKAKLSAKKRRALETASLGKTPRSLTVVSSADGANVLKSIDTLVSEFEKSAVQPKTFIGDVAKALGAKRGGSASEYASFETKNGKIITIRLSNHNAKVSNFDANGETDGISIVVSPKKSGGMTNDGKAHVVEYYYDAIKLRRAEGKPLADIVRSIKQALYSGEFEDTTGLAERQEVNAEITDRVRFFRTAKGEAYGFTVGGKIYIDPKIANTETPIHEYAHLWAAALRGQNPKEWQNIVELMKGTSVWDEVKKRYPELNTGDDIADEVLATYSGRRGAERLREEQRKIAGDKGGVFEKAEAISALERVKQALRKFWKSVADFLHIHYKSTEEVADRVMKDLLDGVDPRKHFNSRMDESKSERIEKLRESKPVEITGDEYKGKYELNRESAKEWLKNNLRGEYRIKDTGETVELRKDGIQKVTSHSMGNEAHLKSLAAIPQMIENSIFIDEVPNEKNNGKYDRYRYYVCGLKIGGEDYTAKITIGVKGGYKYYDHSLTQIEKGSLLDNIDALSTTYDDKGTTLSSVGKDSRLLSILQVKDEKKPNDELYRVGGSKELRDGRKIEFVRKPTATYNALARHLQAEGIKPDMHEARTGSRYMSFEKDGVQWEVRSSDHTKPEYYGEAQKPVELTYYKDKQGEENLSVSVDLGTSGYNIEDMKALMAEIDRLKNDAGEVKESFYRGAASDEVMERYPLLSQTLGVKSENEVRAKEEAREHAEEARKHAEEARKQEMRSAVEDMAGRLHLNNVDIVDKPAGRGAGRRERAKGMFERSTGRITINIGNCADKRDAVVTLLHEAVAHHGLRKLFGENFETFLDNVYNSANAEIRRIIDKHSRRYGGDKRTATEEYMASLAERTDFENAKKSGWWQRIKDFFLKMLEKIGLKGFKGEDLSDNELRYVLWRSYENLKSGGKDTVFSAADDLAKQSELNVGEFAPDAKKTARDAKKIAPDAKKTAPEENAEEVNERFNNELTRYQSGDMDKNEMLHLGKPQGVMRTFLPNLPIVMRQRVIKKGSEKKHEVDVSAIMNMPQHLSSPIFVFQRSEDTIGVLTDMRDRNGKNVCVAIELKRQIQQGAEYLEVNDVRSFHGREFKNIVEPIANNKALKWVDKEKGLAYLSSASQPVQQEIDKQVLDTATKVVENFENPKSESKNDALFRDGDAKDYEKAQARETYERRVSTGMFQSREAIQDSMLSLKVAMDAIEEATSGKAKRIEDYDGFENAYLGENRLSSVNQAESAAFAHLLIRPMMEEVNRLAPTAEDRAELIDYMFAKHGLERNAYMRQQAAEKKLAEYKKQNPGTAKTAADFIDAERDYAGLTTLTGEADVSAAEAEAQRMVAEYEKDYTFHGIWNEIYVCRKKIC